MAKVNEGLKQRVVGALVLGCVAAVFLPVLFVPPQHSVDEVSRMPQLPEVRAPQPEAPPVSVSEPKPELDGLFQPREEATPAPEPAPQAEPTISRDASGNAVSWVVQVASFKQREPAQAVVDDLRKDGFQAFVKSRAVQQERVYRVYVGPLPLREKALKLQARLEKVVGGETLLLQFRP